MPPFDDIKDMTARQFFADVIIGQLSAGNVVCGQSYRFGKDREGDCTLLSELCVEYGIGLTVVPPVCDEVGVISSTRIKGLLKEGNIKKANELLDSRYSITITVGEGRKIGRQLGLPTINGVFGSEHPPIRTGVYASEVLLDKWYKAVTNIGYKPTIDDNLSLNIETHIIGFDGDLYGKTVEIFPCRFLRDEMRFGSKEELKLQIESDIAKT
jgi:riboflavin kinase/FMN adenylyltransferase